MLQYNPITANGEFAVAANGQIHVIKASCKIEAKYKVAKRCGIKNYWTLKAVTNYPTKRTN